MWSQIDRKDRVTRVLQRVSEFCVTANNNGLPLAFTFVEPDWHHFQAEHRPLVVEFQIGRAHVRVHLRQDQMMHYKDEMGWVDCLLKNAVVELTRVLCNS